MKFVNINSLFPKPTKRKNITKANKKKKIYNNIPPQYVTFMYAK